MLTVGDLEHCGAGNLVRSLKEEGICEGWKDLYLIRECVGTWDAETGTIRRSFDPGGMNMTSFEPTKKIVANLIDPEEIRIAILDDTRANFMISSLKECLSIRGQEEIYKARVDSVLPGMHSAFLNRGMEGMVFSILMTCVASM